MAQRTSGSGSQAKGVMSGPSRWWRGENRRSGRRFAATLVLSTIALAGCGDGSGDSTSAASRDGAAAGAAVVTIKSFAFEPATLRVRPGTEVRFRNDDEQAHTATDEGSFDTDVIEGGEEAVITVEEPGTFAYICKLHPFMKGSITASD